MAISVTAKAVDDVAAPGNSESTASVTFAGSKLYVAVITCGDGSTPNLTGVSGCNLTWEYLNEQTITGLIPQRIWVYVAKGTPSAGSLTFTFSATVDHIGWSVFEVGGVNLSGTNAVDAVAQHAKNVSTSSNTVTVTLGSAVTSGNAVIAGWLGTTGSAGVPAFSQTESYTEIHEDGVNAGLYRSAVGSQYNLSPPDNSVTGAHSGASSNTIAGIAFEVKREPVTGTAGGSLQTIAASASGGQTQTGTAGGSLQGFTADVAGVHEQTGTGTANLKNLTAQAHGVAGFDASGAGTLQTITASATGAQIQSGTGSATLASVTAAGSGVMHPAGSAGGSLQTVTAAASGTQVQSGTAQATLQQVTLTVVGEIPTVGRAAATLPRLVAFVDGYQLVPEAPGYDITIRGLRAGVGGPKLRRSRHVGRISERK